MAKENIETLMRVQPPNTSGWLCSNFCFTWLYYRSEMPRIWRTDSWPIRNGKYHKEVVCVCVWAYIKDLQTTLGSALIEAFPNFDVPFIILWWRELKRSSVARACNVITRFLSLLQTFTHLDSFIRRKLTLNNGARIICYWKRATCVIGWLQV